MKHYAFYEYIEFDNERFFTVILLPDKEGRCPTVIYRSPYVQAMTEQPEDDIVRDYLNRYAHWLDRGYGVVCQHCRGQGKSTGAFVPYVHEREDGLALRRWLRKQPFYNGELFLAGYSYTASVHYATAPFEADIKGAVLEAQDSERYRLWYRNGQMRKGHANWHFGLYKNKCGFNKAHTIGSFSQLPLKNLSERVLHDRAEDFEQMLAAQYPADGFWGTRFGGADARGATDHAAIPVLLTTGYNDFYVGGVFKMWSDMDEQTKSQSALLVSPYDHTDGYNEACGLPFPKGKRSECFGSAYQIDWFDHIRKGSALPYEKGVITYYRAFENHWRSDFYETPTEILEIPLGKETIAFSSDPMDPPAFSQEGTFLGDTRSRTDVITLCTEPFTRDVFIKGQMKAVLTVSSSSPDTSFYVNVSIKKPQGDYVLRHDITSLCYQLGDYTPDNVVTLRFSFDEHAFLLKKGERLRIDIASTDHNTYVCHTNKKGPYHLQNGAATAVNKVYLQRSLLLLPAEKQ